MSAKPTATTSKLVIALDYSDLSGAIELLEKLHGLPAIYKFGFEIIAAGGTSLAQKLCDDGISTFIDLKLLDIPNTVQQACAKLADMGVDYTTVHSYPQALEAAVSGKKDSQLNILGVTALTSLDDADLVAIGYHESVVNLVERRTKLCFETGASGVICSSLEARNARAILGQQGKVITPGVRLEANSAQDQKRVTSPAQAIENGASHVVVGREITQSADPRAVTIAILDSLGG